MKKITIENMDGTMEEVDLVNSFDVKDINKNYTYFEAKQLIIEALINYYRLS